MPYTPELPPEIKRRMLSRLVGLSKLVDLAEGSEVGTLLGVVADELSSHQQRLSEYVEAHFLDAGGDLLDERVGQLPGNFSRRRGAQAARGGGVSLTREDTSAEEVYQPGKIVIARSAAPSVSYLNMSTVTFGIGVDTVTDVVFLCSSTGSAGNAPANALDTLLSATGTIYEVTSALPVTGGSDREGDDDLRARAKLWVAALTRTTPDALVAIAMNFVSSDGYSLRYSLPILWEDPDNRGYSELLIDDGFGFTGYTKDAVSQTGTFPDIAGSPRHQVTFDYPAHTAPTLYVNGTPYPSGSSAYPHPDFLVLEERGLIITKEAPTYIDVTAGNTWETKGHKVYWGFPAELQAYIEAYCRAAGTRVRVRIPVPQPTRLSANVTVSDGFDVDTVFDRVKRGIVGYAARVPPGQPILMFRLGATLISIPGVRNVKFDVGDLYPNTPRTKLVIYYSGITLR